MRTASMIGSMVVTIALIFYSFGFFREQKRKCVGSDILLFLTLGVFFDITATILMIIGSSQGGFTVHGLIGYSSLLGMTIDTFLLWKHNLRQGAGATVGRKLHLYSRIAWSWWVIAYITGGVLVALRNMND